ncbi:MAG: glucose-6-phosphate isomerase [Dysgonamonadaceae bacterium]|jgi:glucose-6-phosphate isomerase|nr:glucose-6-phosphate isomerase [Dysgonamonadaceae bacterium]
MSERSIKEPEIFFDNQTGQLTSPVITVSKKLLSGLENVFKNEAVRASMDQEQVVYEVECYFPVEEGKKGGLFWGVSRIYPGKVAGEYFMTRGHFHSESDTAEFYWGIAGKGVLVCMDTNGQSWAEYLKPNSLHYIAGNVAHRVANIGNESLIFGACWLSDAGHDYASIEQNGFSVRLVDLNGKPTLIEAW